MAVRVITDTSCDLPEEYLHRYAIEMLPLKVTFENDDTYLDRIEISPANLFRKCKRHVPCPRLRRLIRHIGALF